MSSQLKQTNGESCTKGWKKQNLLVWWLPKPNISAKTAAFIIVEVDLKYGEDCKEMKVFDAYMYGDSLRLRVHAYGCDEGKWSFPLERKGFKTWKGNRFSSYLLSFINKTHRER